MINIAASRASRAAQRLLSASSTFRRNVALSYGFGLSAFIAALVLRFALEAAIPRFPFITFIPAIIITAFLAGTRSGAFCAALSFLSAWFWFVDPLTPFSTSLNAVVGLSLFAFIIAVDIAIIDVASKVVDDLTKHQAQLSTIIETVPLGLVMAESPSGRIVGGNKYIEKILRHPVLHSPDIDSFDDWVSFHEDGSRVRGDEYPIARMILNGEENPSMDVLYQRGDGSKGWVRIVGRPVVDKVGRVTGCVAAVIDINDQRETQAALAEALQAKNVLLHEVNHRIKNSLQLVNSILLLEASKLVDQQARSAIMIARNKVELIAKVHQRLYKTGMHDRLDLKSYFEETIHDIIKSAGRDDVILEMSFSGNLVVSFQQASPLALATNEIVTNSLKYGLNSSLPKLVISATHTDNKLTLSIHDNGPGLSAKTSAMKSGFGTQIVEGLVSQMRGRVDVTSDISGTKVVLILPTDLQSSNPEGNS